MKTKLLAICTFAAYACLYAPGNAGAQGEPIPLADPSILFHDGVVSIDSGSIVTPVCEK